MPLLKKGILSGFDARCRANQVTTQMGIDIVLTEAKELDLHYGVNTDAMISGQACTLGYTGEILGDRTFWKTFKKLYSKDSVKDNDHQIIVGGDAYGTGSSREVAVVAHQGAGIEVVVAKSFQRIFQENMVYSGLPFTSDFSILQRLESGEKFH